MPLPHSDALRISPSQVHQFRSEYIWEVDFFDQWSETTTIVTFIYWNTNLLHTPTLIRLTHCIHNLQWLKNSWLGQESHAKESPCMQAQWFVVAWRRKEKSKGRRVTSYVWRGTHCVTLSFLFISEKIQYPLHFFCTSSLTHIQHWKQTGWHWDFHRRKQYHPRSKW